MKTLIVGIGNTILGDDGVGVHAVRQLQARASCDSVDIIELGTGGLSLLDFANGYDRLIVLDAMVSGVEPGTIYELEGEDVVRTVHLGSSHEADLLTALAMGKELLGKHMPKDVVVIAVEAMNLNTFSEQLTQEVEAALPEMLKRVEKLLDQL
ncbi:MAG: hydrogenase maturation protease [Proteobacteria bacterium]|nr:hydrogenase maturation protease [Pseudomonadota bacterium]